MNDDTRQPEPTGYEYRPSDWYVPSSPEPDPAPQVTQPAATPRRRASKGLIALVLGGGLVLGMMGGAASATLVTRAWMPAAPAATTAPAPAVNTVAAAPTPATSAPAANAPAAKASSAAAPAAAAPAPAQAPVKAQSVPVTAAASGQVSDIAQRVGPAVVLVSSRGAGGSGGIGSGFIIDPAGLLLTNNHVVQGATTLQVTLADGTNIPAKVVGTAPGNDLALVKFDPPTDGLTVAKLGDSDALVTGELAVAIGSPSGLEQTVTAGIVSSTGRTFGGGTQRPLRGLIQTDAAINPGNSGGPLLNGNGEVVGINTLKAPDTDGIGFAVPINTAKRLLPQLRAGGTLSSPYLGISGRALNAQVAQALNVPTNEGVVIVSVVEGGPAASAGITGSTATQGANAGTGGDVVTAIDGQAVRRVEDIGAILDTKKVGDSVEVTVLRDGKQQTIKVVLGEWPTS